MTAAVANAFTQGLDEMSQPISQAGSPASPTASLQSQQVQMSVAPSSYQTNGRSYSDNSTQPGSSAQSSISLDPPSGVSYPDFLRTWTDSHVARWLTDLKCAQHAQTFKANDIRGDVLLELDQMTLKEMGLVSVGDRIRIISGVKGLRQKCSSNTPLSSIVNRPRVDHTTSLNGDSGYTQGRGAPSRRLDNGRPAPLHLTPGVGSTDLPRLVRDGQDSARSNPPTIIRPLPQPSSSSSNGTPNSSSHTPIRTNLPPLPPPPRGQPPQPPSARTPRSLLPPTLIAGRRTPTLTEPNAPAFTNQPLPPAPNHLTPTSQTQGNWSPYDRSGSSGGRTPARSPSPLPPQPTPNRNYAQSPNSATHGRNASYSGTSPATRQNDKLPPRPATGNSPSPHPSHPYAQSTLQTALSPIHEAFPSQQRANSSTPPPSSAANYRGTPYLRPNTPSAHAPSLDDLRRKLIKFSLPDEGKSTTINVADCLGGPEVLEKALRKFGKLAVKGDDTSMHVEIMNGGLIVEGWAAFLDWGQEQTTEDGYRIEVTSEDSESLPPPPNPKALRRQSMLQYLPPVAFPSESLSESMNLPETSTPAVARPLSAAMSIGSKRMSYITELRSKRDKSDTASLMTVDEITAEVESRRASMESRGSGEEMTEEMETGTDEWTEIGADDTDKKSIMQVEEEYEEEEEEDEEDEEVEEDESDATVTDEEEDQKPITSHGERTIKWIKGALIGAGSFGKVYLGMDASTGLLMAVKQVELPTGTAPNEERKKAMLSALEREIELLRDLHHPNIVQYHSSCVDEDHLNIFLEYVPGGSVTSVLRNYGAFEEPLVRNWVRQILTGLNYLHERDIIHRDIKGANMLVDNKGGIKISDFGISKKVEDNLLPGHRAHRPSLQGSVFWMAPEVVKQTAYTKKADIWSIGCLVVEMLTGEHPWAQLTQMQAIFKIGSSAKPTIPSDICAEAEDFLKLTFELDHEARPTAAELLKHAWMTMT
ncbi:hypothetical protein EUX98_g260 [Antrodiella citrinella]|uniref:Protein kinase domain-containing protein n=1 Tax=Antrodiella citrinella TaxID=2447956 RepID=A0A4S4N7F0_9APHY|nr:hypothetical protein EUX98_g260 [Antrodiella citrinella]